MMRGWKTFSHASPESSSASISGIVEFTAPRITQGRFCQYSDMNIFHVSLSKGSCACSSSIATTPSRNDDDAHARETGARV
eukprot:30294-Pelagococcus_subviridis.AAC.50